MHGERWVIPVNTVRISAKTFDPELAEAVELARHGERTIVRCDDEGKIFAIVPIEDAEYMERKEIELDNKLADEALAEDGECIAWEDLRRELDKKYGV